MGTMTFKAFVYAAVGLILLVPSSWADNGRKLPGFGSGGVDAPNVSRPLNPPNASRADGTVSDTANELTNPASVDGNSINAAQRGTRPGATTLLRNSDLNKQELLQSGLRIDPADASGQLTRAGRALQKHSNRSNSSFSGTSGPPENWNNAGQVELDKILSNPDSQIKYGNRFNGYDIYKPNGQGAAFDSQSTFRTFLEP